MTPATATQVEVETPKKVYARLEPWQVERNCKNLDEAFKRDLKNNYGKGFKKLRKDMTNFGTYWGISHGEADDLVDELWLSFIRTGIRSYSNTISEQFDLSGNSKEFKDLRKYLMTSYVNKVRDYLRKKKRRSWEINESVYYNPSPEDSVGESSVWSIDTDKESGVSTVAPLIADERQTLVRKYISQLKQRYQEVIILANFDNYSYKEMAIILSIPIGTVKSRLHMATRSLEKIIRESGKAAELSEPVYTY